MSRSTTQATAHNNIVAVFADHVEVKSGWQSQNVETLGLKQVATGTIRGLVNATLSLETNTGRVLQLNRIPPTPAGSRGP